MFRRRHDFATINGYLDACREGDYATAAAYLDERVTASPSPPWAPPGTVYRGIDGWQLMIDHLGLRSTKLHLEVELREVGHRILAAGFGWREDSDHKPDVRVVAWLFAVGQRGIRTMEGYRDEDEALAALRRASGEERGDAFEAAPAPMALLDSRGLIVDANRALSELLGLPSAEFCGKGIEEFRAPDVHQEPWDWFSLNGKVVERVLAAADGSKRRVELRASRDYLPGRHVLVVLPRAGGGQARRPVLTEREREIFQLLALGLNGPEIADRLGLSANTVRTHVANGMTALEAKTRAQAVAEALNRGELDLEHLAETPELPGVDGAAPTATSRSEPPRSDG